MLSKELHGYIAPVDKVDYATAEVVRTMRVHRVSNGMRTKPRITSGAALTANACHLGITSLIEDDVYDADGKRLGEVEEIIVDARTGCIRYAVLAFGGLLGFGRQRFAVPWFVLTPDSNYQRCVVDVGLMRITARPVTAADPWLQQTDQTVYGATLQLPGQRNPLEATAPTRRDVWTGGGRLSR